MDEKVKNALLDGARVLLDDVRSELSNAQDAKDATGEFIKLIDTITGRVNQARAGEDAKPKIKIKVGDVLTATAQLDACPDDTILVDSGHDAWQRIEGCWYCTQPEMSDDGYDPHQIVDRPLTVLYLPKKS